MAMAFDAAGYSRSQKAAVLAGWPRAMAHLGVCHKGRAGVACCECDKCVRTMLDLRANGAPRPSVFRHDVTPKQIAKLDLRAKTRQIFALDILRTARLNDQKGQWTKALRAAYKEGRRKALEREGRSRGSADGKDSEG